jgi:hypothetical protein
MIETTIVINTCDAYEDVLGLYFSAFQEHWPGCPYKIVLNTESKKLSFRDIDVTSHNFNSPTGQDIWGLRLKQTLNSCQSKYVIMLYDDFILEGRVGQEKITSCVTWLEENADIAVFYFSNIPVNANIADDRFENFELIPKRGDYKLNSAPAIWRRESLLEFVEDSDNPWAWEFFGSYRTYRSPKLFYCVQKGHEDIYPYNYSLGGAVYRGKWVGAVVLPLIEKYNLPIDVNRRGLVDDEQRKNKRSLMWKLKFFFLGFKMIGFGIFLYLYRIVKEKLGL